MSEASCVEEIPPYVVELKNTGPYRRAVIRFVPCLSEAHVEEFYEIRDWIVARGEQRLRAQRALIDGRANGELEDIPCT